ncbi:catalase family protein [Labrys miyagiensis]|nr:catalase family protein [Labrys miyagiensis]
MESIDEFIVMISQVIGQHFDRGERPARRDAHAFDMGCVRASFVVESDLPAELQHGVFSRPGKSYEAWIRFSNGNFFPTSPRSPDARGMAIKLMGVEGQKILHDEQFTQDFILINHPNFFVNDLKDYIEVLRKYLEGGFWKQWVLAPLRLRSLRLIWIALRVNLTIASSPLARRYWSMTPYKFGDGSPPYAVKYTAIPELPIPGLLQRIRNVLAAGFTPQRAMQAMLSRNEDVRFNFYIQHFVDSHSTPIEDTSVEWREDVAPIHRVARIVIPRQDIMSKERGEDCEDLSFSPWHSLPAHKPLGLINRVRKKVYLAISDRRHALNGVEPREPVVREPEEVQ